MYWVIKMFKKGCKLLFRDSLKNMFDKAVMIVVKCKRFDDMKVG